MKLSTPLSLGPGTDSVFPPRALGGNVNVRGPVVEVRDPRTVETSSGTSELAEVVVRPERGAREPTQVTLWGKWTETAELLEPGMELLVTDADDEEFRGETQYATTGDSAVVVEPDFLVDVTDVRGWVHTVSRRGTPRRRRR